jgi:MinD superfamily P-loop ATPase
MYTLCWAAKGGCGTTVVAASLALLAARSTPTTLLDLGGDLPAALGLAEPHGPGVGDWLRTPASGADELWGLAVEATQALRIIPAGSMPPLDAAMWARLAVAAAAHHQAPALVIDAGRGVPAPIAHQFATHSLLVVRPCYLCLRRAVRQGEFASGVVVVREPGRALSNDDVTRAIGAPLAAEVPVDPTIARSIDAGLLAARLPGELVRTLAPLVASEVKRS